MPFVENCWALLKLEALTATFLPTALQTEPLSWYSFRLLHLAAFWNLNPSLGTILPFTLCNNAVSSLSSRWFFKQGWGLGKGRRLSPFSGILFYW